MPVCRLLGDCDLDMDLYGTKPLELRFRWPNIFRQSRTHGVLSSRNYVGRAFVTLYTQLTFVLQEIYNRCKILPSLHATSSYSSGILAL